MNQYGKSYLNEDDRLKQLETVDCNDRREQFSDSQHMIDPFVLPTTKGEKVENLVVELFFSWMKVSSVKLNNLNSPASASNTMLLNSFKIGPFAFVVRHNTTP